IDVFNRKLTEWLVEYNFERPHQSLDYLAPAEFVQKYSKVLPMWSSSTVLYFLILLLYYASTN
ncbi:integrase core domain-containing protein, partial [Candidatus Parcubacteria bacterium]|nr:integrase core domain-containing protein [Patescibacteria group bacterium]MCG2686840.1 integrase core domain-containing protein [Candidatus Parcubacteria bacterium]